MSKAVTKSYGEEMRQLRKLDLEQFRTKPREIPRDPMGRLPDRVVTVSSFGGPDAGEDCLTLPDNVWEAITKLTTALGFEAYEPHMSSRARAREFSKALERAIGHISKVEEIIGRGRGLEVRTKTRQ